MLLNLLQKFLLVISAGLLLAQEVKIQLVSTSGEPVPFAMLLKSNEEAKGYFSDQNGFVFLHPADLQDADLEYRIAVLGYKDKYVKASSLKNGDRVVLETDTVVLEPVFVNNDEDRAYKLYGSQDWPVTDYNSTEPSPNSSTMDQNLLWIGVYIKLGKEKNKRLESLAMKFKRFEVGDTVLLKIMSAPDKLKSQKMYPIEEFQQLHNTPILRVITQEGWNDFFPDNENIPLTGDGFFVFLTPLRSRHGFGLESYRKRNTKDLFLAMYDLDYTYDYLFYSKMSMITPAVEVEISYSNN
jgi:hypothetical protein